MEAILNIGIFVFLLALGLFVPTAMACDEEQPSYEGKALPELVTKEGRWFNVAETPPTLKGLRGRHVLVVLTTLW